jgi:hypothetical protein
VEDPDKARYKDKNEEMLGWLDEEIQGRTGATLQGTPEPVAEVEPPPKRPRKSKPLAVVQEYQDTQPEDDEGGFSLMGGD